jgi:hypothetical protein
MEPGGNLLRMDGCKQCLNGQWSSGDRLAWYGSTYQQWGLVQVSYITSSQI